MKLTQAQIELLRKWHADDARRECRQWHDPYALEWGTAKALHKRGMLNHTTYNSSRGFYMLTDAGVAAIGGAE